MEIEVNFFIAKQGSAVKRVKGQAKRSANRILAVSGGADSVYMLHRSDPSGGRRLVAHVNHGARGRESDEDMRLVEKMGEKLNVPVRVRRIPKKNPLSGPAFEERSRDFRYAFLKKVKTEIHAGSILLAHTADDQVETVLMRILEGAGISGLKGIPRKTGDGIERPLLDTWKEDILRYLHRHKVPYRVDGSNFDTRFERNWIRHVLLPLLEKRYGKSVKKRIFTLGERFREIDEFLEEMAGRWMKRNVRAGGKGNREGASRDGISRVEFPRRPYAKLPGAMRKKILQRICFERLGIAPNERLLGSMDRLAASGGASSRLSIGKKATLQIGYEKAKFLVPGMTSGRRSKSVKTGVRIRMDGPGRYWIPIETCGMGAEGGSGVSMTWEEKGGLGNAALRRLAKGEMAVAFDADLLPSSLTVRPLRQGDRIRPFGMAAEKKIKEILIDRKVPRDARWGRPAVCDPEGRILWIPGVLRSDHGPVSPGTRRTIILKVLPRGVKPA